MEAIITFVGTMMSNDWELKNLRRKRAKEANRGKYLDGRHYRKALAPGGAFGEMPAKLYNLCVQGTSATMKHDKKSKDEYDKKSDYDE